MSMLPPENDFGLEPYFAFLAGEPGKCEIYGKTFPTEEIAALLALAPEIHWQFQRRRGRIVVMRFTPDAIQTYDIDVSPQEVFDFDVWRRAVLTLMGSEDNMTRYSDW